MIGFPEERERLESVFWVVLSIYMCVRECVCTAVCTLSSVHMFVRKARVCMPRQEVGATTEQCLCNVSDE